MFFIEKYYSSFTGNTLYSPPTDISRLERTLSETATTKFLKTKDLIKFRWMIEKNGIYWFHGLRRLQPVPYKYTVPPLYFLNEKPRPKAVIRYEQAVKRVEHPMEKVTGTLF